MNQEITKVLLNDLTLITAGDQEILEAMTRVDVHDVPEHRLTADFDHRLRPQRCFLGQSSAKTSRENHDLHGTTIRRLDTSQNAASLSFSDVCLEGNCKSRVSSSRLHQLCLLLDILLRCVFRGPGRNV